MCVTPLVLLAAASTAYARPEWLFCTLSMEVGEWTMPSAAVPDHHKELADPAQEGTAPVGLHRGSAGSKLVIRW